MKLPDYNFSGVSQELVDLKDDVTSVVNFGKYPHQVVTQVPTWGGREGEAVFVNSGNNNSWAYYLNGRWNSWDFSTSLINSWITYSITNGGAILDSLNISSLTIFDAGPYLEHILSFDRSYSNGNYAFAGMVKEIEPPIIASPVSGFMGATFVSTNPSSSGISLVARFPNEDALDNNFPFLSVVVIGKF